MSDPRTDDLADRYGHPSPSRRRAVILASGVVAVVALAWLAWAAWFQSTPDVQSTIRSFEVIDSHQVTTEVSVKLRNPDVAASCVVRAYAADHSVVGERNFAVADTEGTVRLTLPFRTEREATSVEMVGCTTSGQNRPR
ncbi:MAG: DUF4307 domain-containing protein [Marmoricola sp.]